MRNRGTEMVPGQERGTGLASRRRTQGVEEAGATVKPVRLVHAVNHSQARQEVVLCGQCALPQAVMHGKGAVVRAQLAEPLVPREEVRGFLVRHLQPVREVLAREGGTGEQVTRGVRRGSRGRSRGLALAAAFSSMRGGGSGKRFLRVSSCRTCQRLNSGGPRL